MISDDKVEEVRSAADMVGIIGKFVELTRAGREYKARCPFHRERTPSFFVVPDKGMFKCFGCGKSGDVFGFLMAHAGLSFPDAVRHAGRASGVSVPDERSADPAEELNRVFWEMNAFAREWFQGKLRDPQEGVAARRYLERRGVADEVRERFSLGYAPGGSQGLRKAAARRGYGDDVLVEGGLLVESVRGEEPYDRFRDRVVFPIEVFGRRIAGFGGRLLATGPAKAAKYVNSPETPIYRKSELLYGLARARNAVRREKASLLVEGYMDVVSLAACGLENAVAPLGTALSEAQAAQLVRCAKQVVILFDSDSAGQRAAFRAADALLAAGARPLMATLPPGEDPDSAVRSRGPDYLLGCVNDAVDVLDRKLHMLGERGLLENIDGRRRALDKLLPTLRAVRAGDQALRDVYFSQVSERTGVRPETLEVETRTDRPPTRTALEPRPALVGVSGVGGRGRGVERELLLVMIRRPDLADEIAESVSGEDLADASNRAIFQALLNEPELRAPPEHLGPQAKLLFSELVDDPRDLDEAGEEGWREHMVECVRRVRTAAFDRGMRALDARIAEAVGEEDKVRLGQEKIGLQKERQAAAPLDWRPAARTMRTTSRDI